MMKEAGLLPDKEIVMIFNCDGVSFLYFINYQLLEFILYEYIYIFNNYFELKKINVFEENSLSSGYLLPI